jgi:hypothetical protein
MGDEDRAKSWDGETGRLEAVLEVIGVRHDDSSL